MACNPDCQRDCCNGSAERDGLIHQFVRGKQRTLCGKLKVLVTGTHLCAHITCPDCKRGLEAVVDQVFKPL